MSNCGSECYVLKALYRPIIVILKEDNPTDPIRGIVQNVKACYCRTMDCGNGKTAHFKL